MNKEQVKRKHEERKTLGIGSIPVTIMILYMVGDSTFFTPRV
jgi:hypothetical protein